MIGAVPGAVSSRPVPGGDINDAHAVELEDGRRVFVKTRPGARPDEYAGEAEDLRWLAAARSGLRVPRVVHVGSGSEPCLALEWIDAGGPLDERALGRGLARLHAAGAPGGFGGPRSFLRVGAVELPNGPAATWPAFYVTRRLEPLARMGRDRGALTAEDVADVERVCARIDALAGPSEPPARLHGDLWPGNVLAAADGGAPWLVDPAAYGGHREVDLAMFTLFGGEAGPGSPLLAAYEDVAPLADGWRERVALWQLLPLLVHAVLFGGGYGARAARAARGYA